MPRIHIQNKNDAPEDTISPELWQALGGPECASFADDEVGFWAGIAEADYLVTATSALRPFLTGIPARLRGIFCTSAGMDSLAPFDWLPPGTKLMNNSGVHAARGGEYVAMALLMLRQEMPAMIAAQQRGQWEKHYTSVLRGCTLVSIGTGALGAAGARAARLFGMTTIGVRTKAEPHPDFDRVVATTELDLVLPHAEFLLLAAPLTQQSRHILDARRIARLPKGAGVINIGRGGLIEQDALCDALDSGALGGAVLDVFTPEPIPPGHRLWTTRHLLITPHVSADDPAIYARDSVKLFLANLAAIEANQTPPNLVDITRGY